MDEKEGRRSIPSNAARKQSTKKRGHSRRRALQAGAERVSAGRTRSRSLEDTKFGARQSRRQQRLSPPRDQSKVARPPKRRPKHDRDEVGSATAPSRSNSSLREPAKKLSKDTEEQTDQAEQFSEPPLEQSIEFGQSRKEQEDEPLLLQATLVRDSGEDDDRKRDNFCLDAPD